MRWSTSLSFAEFCVGSLIRLLIHSPRSILSPLSLTNWPNHVCLALNKFCVDPAIDLGGSEGPKGWQGKKGKQVTLSSGTTVHRRIIEKLDLVTSQPPQLCYWDPSHPDTLASRNSRKRTCYHWEGGVWLSSHLGSKTAWSLSGASCFFHLGSPVYFQWVSSS